MKRIFLMVFTVLFILCLLTGCNLASQASPQQEELEDPVSEREKLATPYINLFESQNYYVRYRGEYEDEKTKVKIKEDYEVAVSEKSLSIRVTSGEDVDSTMLIVEGKKHILNHKEKMDHISEPTENWVFPTQGYVFIETGVAEIEGISYVYEDYSTDLGGFRFFFNENKELVTLEAFSEDGDNHDSFRMEILEWSKEVPAEIFEIPEGYETQTE